MKPPTLEENLQSIAQFLAKEWFIDQCKNPFGEYKLFCRTALPGEKIAHPIIAEVAPNDNYTATAELNGGMTQNVAYQLILDTIKHQPILGE